MIRLILPLLLLGTAAAPAPSKAPEPEPEPVITVQGLPLAKAKALASEMVRAVQAAPASGQLPRWNAPVCPEVLGLADEHAAIVTGRLRRLAEASGAPLGEAGCTANLLIAFTADAPALTRYLNRRNHRVVRAPSLPEKRELLSSPAPVRWWYATRPEHLDGRPLTATSSAGDAAMMMGECVGGPCGTSLPMGEDAVFLEGHRNTLLGSSMQVSIQQMTVLVDVEKATGKTLTSVADYIAFVALAAPRFLPGKPTAPSIIGLFDDPAGSSDAISPWDEAYVRAVYAVRPDQPARTQRAAVAGRLVEALTGAAREGR